MRRSDARILAAVLALAATASNASTSQPYNISITDQSPLISYSPSTIGDGVTGSWNISYSASPWTSFDAGQYNEGLGQSSHWTTSTPAYASFSFVGTAVYAFGNQTDGNSYFVIDGVTAETNINATGLLAKAEGLSEGLHNAQLSWKGAGGINVTGFTMTVGVGDAG